MSQLKQKLKKLKKKPTFKSAEVKALTEKESQKLSRSMILEWFKNHRWGKLKALQLEITEKTEDEKLNLRELIVANTKKNLENQKRAAEGDKVKGIEKFAKAITGIDDEPGTMQNVLKLYTEKQRKEDLFYKTLDAHVGRDSNKQVMKNMIKDNKVIASMIQAAKQANPQVGHDMQLAINSGDYKAFKKTVAKAGFSAKQVDYAFGFVLTGDMGKKEFTGNKTIDGWVNSLNKMRYVGHTYAMKKAAQDAEVSFWMVMRLGNQTVSSVRVLDNNLQGHKHLLENKEKQGIKDKERLLYIEEVHKMRVAFDKKIDNKGVEDNFNQILSDYLDTKKELTAQMKTEIKANATLAGLRMYQVFDLIYAAGEDRSRLLFHSIARVPALAQRYYRLYATDENRHLKSALRDYNLRRASTQNIWEFRRNAKKWGLNDIVGGIEDLERKMGTTTKAGDLATDSARYNIDATGKNITSDEVFDRDMIVKKYHILAHTASRKMTELAKPIVESGSKIDKARKTFGKNFESTKISAMKLDDKYLKALFPPKGSIQGKTGRDLIRAYGERLVELKTMQDVTKARFAALGDTIEHSVEAKFQPKMQGQLDDIETQKYRKEMKNATKDRSRTTRFRKWAPRLILPGIILGVEGAALWSGKAKTNEFTWDMVEAGGGFIPIVGTAMDFKAAFGGYSLSGKKLKFKEQALSFVFGCVGAVADVTMVVGGAGLGIRAALGGMRGTRRALQAGRTMGKLSDAGHIAKRGPITGAAAWVASKFNKAERLESAATAGVKAKAMEQAGIIRDIERASGKRIDSSKLDGEIAQLRKDYGLDEAYMRPKEIEAHLNKEANIWRTQGYSEVEILELKKGQRKILSTTRTKKLTLEARRVKEHVDRLEKLRKGLAPGNDYMKILGEGAVKIPRGVLGTIFGAPWMKVHEKWLKIKKALIGMGVKGDAIREYEKVFDKVRDLKKSQAHAMDEIRKISHNRQLMEGNLKKLADQAASSKDKFKKNFIKALDDERDLLAHKAKLGREVKVIAKRKAGIKEALKKQKAFDKASPEQKAKLRKGLEEVKEKAGIAKNDKVTNQMYKSTQKEWMNKTDEVINKQGELKKVQGNKEILSETVKRKNAKWYQGVTDTNAKIKGFDDQLIGAQRDLKKLNTDINNASAKRFRIRQEMELKAEAWVHRTDNLRRVSKYLQYGGMGMGAIWFLSDWKADPYTQVKYAAKAGWTGVKYGGKAINYVYFENHSGQDALDKLIQDRIAVIDRKTKMQTVIADAEKRGKTKLQVLAENSQDPGAQEIIRREGLTAKLAAFRSKLSGKLKSPIKKLRREAATGDTASKAGETLRG